VNSKWAGRPVALVVSNRFNQRGAIGSVSGQVIVGFVVDSFPCQFSFQCRAWHKGARRIHSPMRGAGN
jgi:hypothetical protein